MERIGFVKLFKNFKQGGLLLKDKHQHKYHSLYRYLDQLHRYHLLKLRLQDTR